MAIQRASFVVQTACDFRSGSAYGFDGLWGWRWDSTDYRYPTTVAIAMAIAIAFSFAFAYSDDGMSQALTIGQRLPD